MRAQIITICDSAFSRLMKVALGSLHLFGGAKDVDMAVYDFGLSDEDRAWCLDKDIEVRSMVGAPRELLGVERSAMQRVFDLWICKTWAIKDAADRFPDGVVLFIDSDMAFLQEVVPFICETALRDDVDIVAVQDAMDCVRTLTSFQPDAPEAVKTSEFWQSRFGVDCTKAPTWNIGLIAARSEVIQSLYSPWQELNLKWNTDEMSRDFPIPCFDQLTFTIAVNRAGLRVGTIPNEFNVTRPLWNNPTLAAKAQVIHLTGQIKPWQEMGQFHPMTYLWRSVEKSVREAGYIE